MFTFSDYKMITLNSSKHFAKSDKNLFLSYCRLWTRNGYSFRFRRVVFIEKKGVDDRLSADTYIVRREVRSLEKTGRSFGLHAELNSVGSRGVRRRGCDRVSFHQAGVGGCYSYFV